MTPKPTPRRRFSRRQAITWLLALAAIAAIVAWVGLTMREAGRPRSADDMKEVAARVLAQYSQGLPKPFGPGLMIERVHFEGSDLVMTLSTSKPGIADALRDPAMLARVREAEHREMLPLCGNREALALVARGMTITRRFVDTQGREYFSVTLSGDDCRRARPSR